jgi:hypothetical protein
VTDNSTDFFDGIGGGSGAPGAVLKQPGDLVHGVIVDMFKRPYIPFGKTEVEKWDKGPKAGQDKQQLVVTLQTNERNWANVNKVPKVDHTDSNSPEKPPSDDDGKRAVYVPEGKNIQFAIGRAVQSAGVGVQMTVGGTLGVRVDKLTPTDKGNDLKEHVAVYQVPAASAGFFPEGQAAPAASTPAPAAPAPTPEPTPAPAAPVPAAQDPWATPATPAAPAASDPWASTPATTSAPAPSEPPF